MSFETQVSIFSIFILFRSNRLVVIFVLIFPEGGCRKADPRLWNLNNLAKRPWRYLFSWSVSANQSHFSLNYHVKITLLLSDKSFSFSVLFQFRPNYCTFRSLLSTTDSIRNEIEFISDQFKVSTLIVLEDFSLRFKSWSKVIYFWSFTFQTLIIHNFESDPFTLRFSVVPQIIRWKHLHSWTDCEQEHNLCAVYRLFKWQIGARTPYSKRQFLSFWSFQWFHILSHEQPNYPRFLRYS